jgi:hypothetical protein
MTTAQVEEKLIELRHRQPFKSFEIEMNDGRVFEVLHPGLAINEDGVGFFGPDGGLVDIEFKAVRAIRVREGEAVA